MPSATSETKRTNKFPISYRVILLFLFLVALSLIVSSLLMADAKSPLYFVPVIASFITIVVMRAYALNAAEGFRERLLRAGRGKSDKPDGDQPHYVVLFVHGMGLQDRFQQLTQFTSGIAAYTTRKGISNNDKPGGDPGLSISNDHVDCHISGRKVRFYEAFWAPKFNGIVKVLPTIYFTCLTLWGFLTSITRPFFYLHWRKRVIELIFAITAILLLSAVLYGLYGSTLLASHRLIIRDSGHVHAPIAASFGDDSLQLLAIDKPTRKVWLDRVTLTWQQVAQSWAYPSDLLTSREESLRDEHPTKLTAFIPVTETYETLGKIPFKVLLKALVYSVAWFFLILGLTRFLRGLIPNLSQRKSFQGRPNHPFVLEQKEQIALALARSLTTAGLAGIVVTLLDPIVDLGLAHLFMSYAMLVLLLKGLGYFFTNVFGDVMIYATSNENSEYYAAREAATAEVSGCLKRSLSIGVPVVVVGHSLGSVIALTAIRKLKIEADPNLKNLTHFITLGSPLRKFRHLFSVRSYKSRYSEFNQSLDSAIFREGHTEWTNFWFLNDIFADSLSSDNPRDLDAFPTAPDRKFGNYLGWGNGLWVHSSYWLHPRFVEAFWNTVLSPNNGKGPPADEATVRGNPISPLVSGETNSVKVQDVSQEPPQTA